MQTIGGVDHDVSGAVRSTRCPVGIGCTDGTGFDRFVYRDTRESANASRGGTGIDRIVNLNPGQDRIDLSAIDANGAAPGNGAFRFIGGQAFTGAGAEVRFTGTYVLADVNGDRQWDMAIEVGGATALSASDFIL